MSEICKKIVCLTFVTTVIVALSAFSVYIHYDFVVYPKAYSVELNQSGWKKSEASLWTSTQKGYDAFMIVFMLLNGLLIIYRYFVAFFADPGTYDLESNLKIQHKPEKEEEIKKYSRELYADIVLLRKAGEDFENREMILSELKNPLVFEPNEN